MTTPTTLRLPRSSPAARRRSAVLLLSLGLLAPGLAACAGAGAEPPALCQDMDAMAASAQKIRDTNPDANAPEAIKAEFANMKAAFEQFKVDAADQFKTQIDAVQAQAAELQTSVEAAKAAPSSTTLKTLRDDFRQLQTAFMDLQSAVRASC